MAGHPFDRPSLYSGPHAGVLRARHGRLPRRAPGAFDRMGVADAEIRQPVGVSPVPRGRGPDDHPADFRQLRGYMSHAPCLHPPRNSISLGGREARMASRELAPSSHVSGAVVVTALAATSLSLGGGLFLASYIA